MKKNVLLSCLFLVFLFQGTADAVVQLKKDIAPESTDIVSQAVNEGITAAEFVELSPKELARKTGKKLSLKEKIAFRLAKNKVKKALKKNGNFDLVEARGGFRVEIVGLLLGLFLGLIGLLLAYVLFDDRNQFKSAVLGLVIAVVLSLGLFVAFI